MKTSYDYQDINERTKIIARPDKVELTGLSDSFHYLEKKLYINFKRLKFRHWIVKISGVHDFRKLKQDYTRKIIGKNDV